MILYKVKHIPTGLFFTPSKGRGNLSRNGKLYTIKPRFEWYETIRIIIMNPKNLNKFNKILVDYFKPEITHYHFDRYFKTNENEWEIIEFKYKDIEFEKNDK